jgi:hypothetical protein
MINHKFRCTYVTDKEYALFLIKHRVRPLNHFVSNNREIWVFDHQDTKIYNIAFKALN